jgi:hypothetical protein
MKTKLTKSHWQFIGTKAGWIKESQNEFDHRDPKNYAPGQTPYTDEEWSKVKELIKDESHKRDFKPDDRYKETVFNSNQESGNGLTLMADIYHDGEQVIRVGNKGKSVLVGDTALYDAWELFGRPHLTITMHGESGPPVTYSGQEAIEFLSF